MKHFTIISRLTRTVALLIRRHFERGREEVVRKKLLERVRPYTKCLSKDGFLMIWWPLQSSFSFMGKR